MATDKERADFYRSMGAELLLQNYNDAADHFARMADELDPPKPTWPDGTIAWVTIVDLPMKKYLGVRVGDEWRDGYGPDDLRRRLCAPSVNVKVEPLRVLGDDEIAVKRTEDINPETLGVLIDNLSVCKHSMHLVTQDVLELIRDALDDEQVRP